MRRSIRSPRAVAFGLAAAAASTIAVVAVPTSDDVPWYATTILACALSGGCGLFAWAVAFVSDVRRRLAILERATGERSG